MKELKVEYFEKSIPVKCDNEILKLAGASHLFNAIRIAREQVKENRNFRRERKSRLRYDKKIGKITKKDPWKGFPKPGVNNIKY